MIHDRLFYGFLDESGILEKKAETGRCFIIVIIIIGAPIELKRVMKHARRMAQGKLKVHSIFKANKESKEFVKLVLRSLSKSNAKIIIGIWDKNKKGIYQDKNIVYAQLLAQTINIALAKYLKLHIVIHKRYTSPALQRMIVQSISEAVKDGFFLSIDQRTEVECRELELADAVAWAVFQKYNNKKLEFYNIIQDNIIKENRLAT